ncbi:hypothetical protein [Methanobrevibacter arboriphilus]|uniref:hypothetical protein n=1 Tax=Methanobrevibacter arboriphilus TaxID=39441 RepID=UPI001C7F88C5|nr:hypothetical protein [Methanobrevibacter arboriphilus]
MPKQRRQKHKRNSTRTKRSSQHTNRERKHTQMDIRNRTTSTICITNYNNRITYKNIIKIIY